MSSGGELHFRGGRGGEVKVQFDGVEASDPLFGRSAGIANLAVAGADVLSGGFDAEYGNALSGVVNVQTREGGQRFGGEVRWHTDRYGETIKTFNNYDRFTFGLGGPTPIKDLTYFATYEGTWSDTYLKQRPHLHAAPTSSTSSRWATASPTRSTPTSSWPTPRCPGKLTFETINNRTETSPYYHSGAAPGTSRSPTTPPTRTGSRSTRRGTAAGRSTPRTPPYQYYNAADHMPTVDDALPPAQGGVDAQPVDKTVVYTVRVARNEFSDAASRCRTRSRGSTGSARPYYWSGNVRTRQLRTTRPTATSRAGPTRSTTVYSGKTDYSTRALQGPHAEDRHRGEPTTSSTTCRCSSPTRRATGCRGRNRSDFVNYNPEGAVYVQDRWEYEGLVLNAGAALRRLQPGRADRAGGARRPADRAAERYKQQCRPRLGIAYPISDRDVLSFHYGWTYQTPARNFVFENRGTQSNVAVRGNPEPAARDQHRLPGRHAAPVLARRLRPVLGVLQGHLRADHRAPGARRVHQPAGAASTSTRTTPARAASRRA